MDVSKEAKLMIDKSFQKEVARETAQGVCKYLEIPYIEEVQPQPVPKIQYGVVTVNSSLNVRNGAGTKYKTIGSLKNGTKVRIGGVVGDWYSIYFGDHGGFVHKDYIKLV
jgi:uncharacterized protein YgiM (DUF1202 family)